MSRKRRFSSSLEMSRSDPGGNNSLRTVIFTDSLALAACCEDGTPVATKKSSIDSSHSTGSIPGENDRVTYYICVWCALKCMKPAVAAGPVEDFPRCAIPSLGSARSRRQAAPADCLAQSHSKNLRSCPQPPDSHIAGTVFLDFTTEGHGINGVLETAVRGRTMAIPEQYDGSSDWDEWLEHFEDAAAVNGWSEAEKLKWLPLSLSQKESWSDIGRDIRRLVEKAYLTLSDDAKDIIGLDKFLNTLDRPELLLLVKQRNPKNIEEAVRAALEVEFFMIRPGPDTGSAVTLVQSGIPTEPWRNGSFLAAYVTHLTVSGKRWAKLEIGNQAFTHPVVIVENLVQQALLGRDFLRRFGCTLNKADAVLQIHGESVRLVEATTARSNVDVIIEEDVTLVPFTESSVMVRTTSADNCHGPWLLEQRPEGRLPVAVARAVVHPREGCVPVQLLNPSGDRVTIHQGKVVATIEVVDPLPLERSPQTHAALPTAIENAARRSSTSEELDKLRALLTDFADVFSTYDSDIGRTTQTEHHINTGDAKRIGLCPRRIPWHFREQMDGLLTDMINKDIIEPSTSTWTTPVVLVKKKDGDVRFYVDFRKLNLVTKKDSYPLPRIDETIDTLAGAE
ncbi:Transposon Ty3-I Gag-Pol polyprotein [Trichinella spiralis]|nr:Transposon Ty3-I Gag-Pol polyprotein [Trichinella spiralis]